MRERIDLLIDPFSPFMELSPLAAWGLYDNAVPAAGLVTGIGTIRGVICMIIANDATTKGGSFFKETIRKHVRAQDIAFENKLPVVYLVDCGGANLQQGDEVFPDQDHFGGAFYRQCRMSAAGIPQIATVFGECTAGGAYIPALADEVVMTARQQQRPSRRPADRESRDPRDRRSRHAGRRGDAQHGLRRLRPFRARRDGGDRQDARHRRRAQPRPEVSRRHPPGARRRCSMPEIPGSSAPT